MRKASLALVLVLPLALFALACGGGGGGTRVDASTIDGGGGGGPDAGDTPDAAGGTPDAMGGGLSAASLGQICNSSTPCPTGYSCLVTMMGAANGFCSLPCADDTDMFTCSGANGFPGPGTGACLFSVMTTMMNFCGIQCGTQWTPPLPPDCPTGLTCSDLTGQSGAPDGMTDFCLP